MTAQVTGTDILDVAREQVLERGVPLTEEQVLEVLRTGDDRLQDLLALAHEVRMKYQGPSVEVEGIVSLKTGGCPEDCHFCSQSGQFTSPGALGVAQRPRARARGEADRGHRGERVLHRRRGARARRPADGADARGRRGHPGRRRHQRRRLARHAVSREQVADLVDMGVHRYNHNLEAGRSYFPNVVTTHSFDERWDTCLMVKESGMELCCGGLVGMGETLEQRAELAAQLGELEPHEVPLNFLNPRPGTPFGDLEPMETGDALRTIAAFRLALPRTILRYAGGRELTLGDLGTREGLLGGINAVIVGNYLTTLGRDPREDLALLDELEMPIKALNETF